VHAAGAYLGMRGKKKPANGGLASWQEKRAKEMIEARLDGDISPAALAQECGLSVSHFARAFRRSTGMAPHQWLLQRRVAKAKQAMRETDAPLVEIAVSCGFADQSHFTRVFSKAAAGVVKSGIERSHADARHARARLGHSRFHCLTTKMT
jgi:AraC family transcriptional regulator